MTSPQSGITLIELTLVILIATLIIGIVTPAYLRIIDKKRTDLAMTEITSLQKDIDRFGRRNARFPSSLTEIYPAIPVDPWGNPYKYTNVKNDGGSLRTDMNLKSLNADYDLYSDGPDKTSLSPVSASESRDDIIRAKNGGFIGVASGYK